MGLRYNPFTNNFDFTGTGGSGGSGTVTSVSVVTANGVSGTVATSTTTPAITLALGAITPSSVNSIVLSGSSTPTLGVTGTTTVSGANTGDQTITLTGGVTGSGTGSFAATVVTNANLTGPITSVGNATTISNSVALPGSPTTTTQASSDNSTKIATTAYVTTGITNALNGLDWKPAVGYATTANVIGTNVAGVFTYTSTGVDTIDGHTLVLNDVVLFKNQTTQANNGVWVVTTAGAVGVAGVLTRRSDYNTAADIQPGDAIYVLNGTVNANTTWVQTATVTTIDSDALTFSQASGPGSIVSGTGITVTGNSVAIDTSVTVDKTTAQTLTNKTLTTPNINEAVALTTTATKLNLLTSAGGTTGTTSTNIVFSTSPTLVTPTLGAATATSINKMAITAPASSSTLAVADGKTLTANATLTLAGTDSTTITFQGTDTYVGRATTDTLTNKRVTKRVLALSAGSATPAINTDSYDVVHITAQNAAITSFTTNLTGTPVDGDTLRVSITDNGTARALTWGTSFESSGSATLPTTTVLSVRLDVGFFYNTETSKWRCVAVA